MLQHQFQTLLCLWGLKSNPKVLQENNLHIAKQKWLERSGKRPNGILVNYLPEILIQMLLGRQRAVTEFMYKIGIQTQLLRQCDLHSVLCDGLVSTSPTLTLLSFTQLITPDIFGPSNFRLFAFAIVYMWNVPKGSCIWTFGLQLLVPPGLCWWEKEFKHDENSETETEAEAIGSATYWLAYHDLFNLILYRTQNHLPWGGETSNGLGLLTPIINLKNAPVLPAGQSSGSIFLNLDFSSLMICVKLA